MSRRIVAIGLLVLGTLLLLFCGFRSTMPIVAAQSTSGMGMGGGSQPATYMLSGGFWRTDGAFISTIRVKNVLVVGPMDVIPTLFMADGTPYVLPSVHIPTSGVATININDALAAAPASMAAHLSPYGTAMLMWTYTSAGHLAASIASIDATRSLSYVFSFTTPMGDPMQQTVDGLWWKHDPNVSGFVAVSNTGDAATQATIQLVGPGVETQPARPLYLGQHSTELFRLEDLATNVAALAPQSGGVRVQYTGAMGSVQVVGGLENDTIGYSANIPFWLHDTSASPPAPISYAFAGLMLGKPDPVMMPGFPKTTAFTPYLVLRNTTEKPLSVALQLSYMAGATAVSRTLRAESLAPLESRQMDLHSTLIAAGLRNFNGSVNLSASFTGKQGDLVLASGSVDQTGTYVFEVEAKGVGKSRIKFSNYWSVRDGNDTMITLWNPTSAPQDIVGTFYFANGNGNYMVAIHLAPQASAAIDIAMLIAQGKPDPNGNTFPANVGDGSAQFASAKGRRAWINLVISSGTYNVTTATCGENCIYCCGDSGFGINPGSFSLSLGDTMACASTAVDCNGQLIEPAWSSSDSTVMTVDGYGNVTGMKIGSADIIAVWDSAIMVTGQECFSGGTPFCPTSSPQAQSGGSVTPSVTFSGTPIVPSGGTAPITATVSPANNTETITLTLSTTSGTGAAIFLNGTSSMTITTTATVTLVGQTTSSQPDNIELTASIGAGGEQSPVGSTTLTVASTSGAIPVDFKQTSVADQSNAVLYFTYSWGSSSGNLSDLGSCTVEEFTTYPGYTAGQNLQFFWPSPPYSSGSYSPNPETGQPGPGSAGTATDTLGHPGFQTPYASATTVSNQIFQFSCPGYRNGQWTQMFPASGTIPITRQVSYNSAQNYWVYTITKSGASNSGELP